MNENITSLIGKEINFIDLDNLMVYNGFYSVFNDGITESIKRDLNVIYTNTNTNERYIMINFEIIIDNNEDEIEDNFILKINEITEY